MFILDETTGTARELRVPRAQRVGRLDLRPDGRHVLAAVSLDDSTNAILRIGVDGAADALRVSRYDYFSRLYVAPDGRGVVMYSRNDESEVIALASAPRRGG